MNSEVAYYPHIKSPSGVTGTFAWGHHLKFRQSFASTSRRQELIAASMPFLRNNLVYSPSASSGAGQAYAEEKTKYDRSRVPVILSEDLFGNSVFHVVNAGVGFGLLRVLGPGERSTFRDVVILRSLPNDLPAFTVEPEGAGTVTITLPATEDCEHARAICTEDDRPLSNSQTAEVAGQSASAVADSSVLTLAWPTPRDGFAPPGGSDFAVRVDGSLRAVSAASLWTRGAVLMLAEPVLAGQDVVVDYLGSAMHPLRDAAGRTEPAWRDLPAVNVTGLPVGGTENLMTPVADGTEWLVPVDALSASFAGRELGDVGLAALVVRPDLVQLDLSGNALTDLPPLAGLRALESLDLSGNAVADLTPLRGLTVLRRLDLGGNAVADLWPLGELPQLEVLLLDGNRVADVGALTHLVRLENLGLAGNAVGDLAPLADLRSLRRLDLGGNPAGDLSPVGDLGTLVWLRLPADGGAAPDAPARAAALAARSGRVSGLHRSLGAGGKVADGRGSPGARAVMSSGYPAQPPYGPETFVVCVVDDALAPRIAAGDYVHVDPDEPAEDGRFVAVWADGPGSETLVRLMAVEDGVRTLRATEPGWPEIALTYDNETMIRGTVVFAGRGV